MLILVKGDDIGSGRKDKAHHRRFTQQGSQWVNKVLTINCNGSTHRLRVVGF